MSTDEPQPEVKIRFRPFRMLARILLWLLLLVLAVWATAALAIDIPAPWLRAPLAIAYALGLIGLMVAFRRWAKLICLGGFVVVLAWWWTLEPSNYRDWMDDVAVLPYAEIDGNRVTVHNIRNCEYRTETDYTVRHYDRTFDLDKLSTADVYFVHWGSPAIAHVMVSFGFDDGSYLCFSIETRMEKGEGYSAVSGFFRQFELTYIVADERDVIRLRTNHRKGEDVYLYRLKRGPELNRQVFLDYLAQVNSLKEIPQWYNAVTSNCANNVYGHMAPYTQAAWSWKILLPGYVAEVIHERGNLDQTHPFETLKRMSLINERAQSADRAADFSARIRAGLPGFEP
jgi:hypothetical protein